MYTVKGYIKLIDEPKNGIAKNGNSWSKTDFIVTEVNGEREDDYFFSLWNKSLGVTVGQMVEVEFFIKTTCYNGKYYTNLIVHDVHPMSAVVDNRQSAPKQQQVSQSPKTKQETQDNASEFGDLPF